MGFAQRRRGQIDVGDLAPAAGKTDLPPMVRQMGGALSQEHGQARWAIHDRRQHPRFSQGGNVSRLIIMRIACNAREIHLLRRIHGIERTRQEALQIVTAVV